MISQGHFYPIFPIWLKIRLRSIDLLVNIVRFFTPIQDSCWHGLRLSTLQTRMVLATRRSGAAFSIRSTWCGWFVGCKGSDMGVYMIQNKQCPPLQKRKASIHIYTLRPSPVTIPNPCPSETPRHVLLAPHAPRVPRARGVPSFWVPHDEQCWEAPQKHFARRQVGQRVKYNVCPIFSYMHEVVVFSWRLQRGKKNMQRAVFRKFQEVQLVTCSPS